MCPPVSVSSLFFHLVLYFYKYVMSDSNMTIASLFKKEKSSKHIITREPPSRLINPTLFIINFAERKFLNIGLDPANNFNVTIHIITPLRHLVISPETLERIFSLMGDILSVLLDSRLKTKPPVFLVDDTMKLSKITCRGENKLAFQSISGGNKVLLSREDVIALQHMEWSTFESVLLKTNVIRPVVLRQLEQMTVYLKSNFPQIDTVEDMISIIGGVSDESLASHIPNEEACFISQLKLYAVKQIVEKWTSATHNDPIKVIKNISIRLVGVSYIIVYYILYRTR